ncbi:hypothetical protein FIM83_02630 [Helicobacter pylori]|nr:hypothetical protein FIM83_02630 [Helicobacter pylori]
MTHNEPICALKTHKTFFDAKSGLIFHLNTALLLVSFFSFLSLCLKKRSTTHCKRWLLVFNFTAIDDKI